MIPQTSPQTLPEPIPDHPRTPPQTYPQTYPHTLPPYYVRGWARPWRSAHPIRRGLRSATPCQMSRVSRARPVQPGIQGRASRSPPAAKHEADEQSAGETHLASRKARNTKHCRCRPRWKPIERLTHCLTQGRDRGSAKANFGEPMAMIRSAVSYDHPAALAGSQLGLKPTW